MIVAFFPALVSVILAEEPFVAFLGTEILIFLLLVTFTVASFLLEVLADALTAFPALLSAL